MVSAKEIDRQLKNIGVSFWFFGNAELRELRHIMVEGEVIEHCILGHYDGGYAVLCATNLRLLLIDKKPFYLTLEDVRYDMIVEVDFAHRLLDATIIVCLPSKKLRFTTRKKHELRLMVSYIQHRVIEFRQQQVMQTQYSTSLSAQPVSAAWQPQAFIEPPRTIPRSMKRVARTAINGTSPGNETRPLAAIQQAVNPYAQNSFAMRQRISRF